MVPNGKHIPRNFSHSGIQADLIKEWVFVKTSSLNIIFKVVNVSDQFKSGRIFVNQNIGFFQNSRVFLPANRSKVRYPGQQVFIYSDKKRQTASEKKEIYAIIEYLMAKPKSLTRRDFRIVKYQTMSQLLTAQILNMIFSMIFNSCGWKRYNPTYTITLTI